MHATEGRVASEPPSKSRYRALSVDGHTSVLEVHIISSTYHTCPPSHTLKNSRN